VTTVMLFPSLQHNIFKSLLCMKTIKKKRETDTLRAISYVFHTPGQNMLSMYLRKDTNYKPQKYRQNLRFYGTPKDIFLRLISYKRL